MRKEAVLSSQIEGTQATLMDLLNYEAEGDAPPPNADVEEVCNYLDNKEPGEVRRSQNWIGGSRPGSPPTSPRSSLFSN